MRPRRRLLPASLLALALAAPSARAEVRVQTNGDRVDLVATAAPLSEVLDRLTRQTGMKLTYEGAPPRQIVTLTVQGRTPTETVIAMFEGLGVNYALMEIGGAPTLLVTGASSPAVASAPAPVRESRPPPPVPDIPDEPFEDEPQDMIGAAPESLLEPGDPQGSAVPGAPVVRPGAPQGAQGAPAQPQASAPARQTPTPSILQPGPPQYQPFQPQTTTPAAPTGSTPPPAGAPGSTPPNTAPPAP